METSIVRPKKIDSQTICVETGCGNMYVIIGPLGGKPTEIFANLSKAGSCSTAQNEALGRAISLGLRGGIEPVEFVRELRGIRCPNPRFSGEGKCLSCAEGMGIALAEYLGIDFYKLDGELNNEVHNED